MCSTSTAASRPRNKRGSATMELVECVECGQMFEPDDEDDELCVQCWQEEYGYVDSRYGDNDHGWPFEPDDGSYNDYDLMDVPNPFDERVGEEQAG
jgi:predicted  nucleic acid-binding Zn-ribbon protein